MSTVKNFDQMGKEELRAACKTAGVAYGKLNNDGMRAALKAKQAEQGIGPVGGDGRPTPVKDAPKPAAAPAPSPAPVVETPVVDSPREKVAGAVVKPKSLKIEKGREKQNDVTRPSAGSICRSIWDALDKKRAALAEAGEDALPTFEHLRELMKQFGWAKNTAMTQYQRWKQFHGVMPRSQDDDETEE